MMCVCMSNLYATFFYFDRITANCDTHVESQFRVDVFAVGDTVAFTFYNDGPIDSSVSEIYFYDGALLGMYSIDDSLPYVDFENIGAKTNPKSLPGYNPNASLVAVLSATEAQTPEPEWGVKPGEWLQIGYTLKNGKSFDDLLTDLAGGEVVLGIHVKAIGCDPSDPSAETFSDSFINTPEPTAIVLLGLGGLLLRCKK